MPNTLPADVQPAIVIPCYNCGAAVVSVVESCKTFSPHILVINDGSTDDTNEIIKQCDCLHIGWNENQGKGMALREGFRYWLEQDKWEILITLDSDGQHDPCEIKSLVEQYQKTKADIVLGARMFNRKEMPAIRYWANTVSSTLISTITGCAVKDLQCGYRLFTRRALEKIVPVLTSGTYSIETEMVLSAQRMGLRIEEADVSAIYLPSATQSSSWKPIADSWNIACVVMKHLMQPKHK